MPHNERSVSSHVQVHSPIILELKIPDWKMELADVTRLAFHIQHVYFASHVDKEIALPGI